MKWAGNSSDRGLARENGHGTDRRTTPLGSFVARYSTSTALGGPAGERRVGWGVLLPGPPGPLESDSVTGFGPNPAQAT